MKAIGSKTYKMAKAATITKAAPCIEGTSKIHSSTEEDRNSFKMVINIKENINRANHTDTENIHGQTEMFTLDISPMVHVQAKEHSKRNVAKHTKDNSKKTINMVSGKNSTKVVNTSKANSSKA